MTGFALISSNDLAVYTLCCHAIYQVSSVKQHFEIKHKKSLEDNVKKIEALNKVVSCKKSQAAFLKK